MEPNVLSESIFALGIQRSMKPSSMRANHIRKRIGRPLIPNSPMNRVIDLKEFQDPRSPAFIERLAIARRLLTHSQIREFYQIVIAHLWADVDITTGKEIIRAICGCIAIGEYFCNVFIDHGFASQLPFNSTYQNDVFDLLSVLLDRDRGGRAFNEELVAQFRTRISKRGEKSLNLISRFATKFNEVDNPAPMLNLLFSEYHRFSRPDVVLSYIKVLAYLVRTFPEFRRDQGDNAWVHITALFDESYIPSHPEIIPAIYDGCCLIADVVKTVAFPFRHAKNHIANPDLAPSVLTLLLVVQLDYNELSDMSFLSSLLRFARKGEKNASLALMRLAENHEIADKLIANCGWLELNLPDEIYTLRLFLVVFQHEDLRCRFTDCREFLTFLKTLIRSKLGSEEGGQALICRILRRVPMTDDFVKDLTMECVITEFMAKAAKSDPKFRNGSTTSVMLILQRIAEQSYTKDLLMGCDMIAKMLQARNEHFLLAAGLAVTLAVHKPCAKKFRELGVVEVFGSLKKEPAGKKLAAKFFEAIGDAY
jgi:hypothetical protein